MGMIEDVMKALERIPLWKRVSAMPDRIDALEKRIAALEQKLTGGSGQLCPLCDSPRFKRVKSEPAGIFGGLGVMADTYQCQDCQHSEQRQRDTMT